MFPPYRTPDAGGELSDLFGRECSGCWDTQEALRFRKNYEVSFFDATT